MSRQYPIVNVSSYTFSNWIDRTNDLVNIVNTDVVTVSSNTSGDLTVGNGFVIGIFGGNTIVATTLRGGNVSSSNTLNVVSNINFSGDQINATSNVFVNAANLYFLTTASTRFVGNTAFYSNTSHSALVFSTNGSNYSLNVNVNSGFIVSGNTVLNNSLEVTGPADFSNTLTSVGAVDFSNTLVVTGSTTLLSSANVDGTLGVGGAVALGATLSVSSTTDLNGTLAVGGNAAFSNTVSVVGNASFTNATAVYFYANTLTGNNLSFGDGITTGNSSGLYSGYYYSGTSNSSSNGLIANSTTIVVGNTSMYAKLQPNGIVANTGEFYNLNITGEIIGTIAPTSNFIPSVNNSLYIGTSANVFNQIYATNTYTNCIHSYSGTVTVHDTLNVTSGIGLNSNSYFYANRVTFTNTANQPIDSFSVSEFRSGEYLLQFSDTNTLSYHVTKLVVYHDGTSAYSSEFAQLYNNSSLAVLTTDVSGSNVRIMVTPTTANVVVKFSRNLITV